MEFDNVDVAQYMNIFCDIASLSRYVAKYLLCEEHYLKGSIFLIACKIEKFIKSG